MTHSAIGISLCDKVITDEDILRLDKWLSGRNFLPISSEAYQTRQIMVLSTVYQCFDLYVTN
jgi:hypothetical protein